MSKIFHLAPSERWNHWPVGEPYVPDAYAQDGFIHCTAGEDLMLRVANHFYRSVPGAFVLLVLEPERLHSELRWEAPSDGLAERFPHVYGPINAEAVVAVRSVQRAPDGTFLGWGS